MKAIHDELSHVDYEKYKKALGPTVFHKIKGLIFCKFFGHSEDKKFFMWADKVHYSRCKRCRKQYVIKRIGVI